MGLAAKIKRVCATSSLKFRFFFFFCIHRSRNDFEYFSRDLNREGTFFR